MAENMMCICSGLCMSLAPITAQLNGMTSGINMPIVPQLVPVVNAVTAERINTVAGTSATGRLSARIETRYWAVCNASVTLDNSFSGHASQYRASERSDFRGAEWQAYEKMPDFQLSAGRGNKTVYFQVRRYARINGADLEARSTVKHDSIVVR